MTPNERAKQITIHCEKTYPVGPNNWYSEIEPLIVAQIEEAEQNAYTQGCADTLHNSPMFEEGFRTAKEKAKGIAESMIHLKDRSRMMTSEEIADRIDKMKMEDK